MDPDGGQCHGCSDFNVAVVRVGEVMSIGEGDFESIDPDSSTACLCRRCLEKAIACFELAPVAADTDERQAILVYLEKVAGITPVDTSVLVLDIAEAIRSGRHRQEWRT